MKKNIKLSDRPIKDILYAIAPTTFIAFIAIIAIYKFVDPAPPRHLVISTGDGEGEYDIYAKLYQEIMKDDGVTLEIRSSSGANENLHRLQDPNSGVDVGFVQDGLGSYDESPYLESLGSLYYEPIWVFYRGSQNISRFSQFLGKKVAVGRDGGGTRVLTLQILKASGVDVLNSQLLSLGSAEAEEALHTGTIDAAFFMGTPDDPRIKRMIRNPSLRLMSVNQADAITRQIPFLHHLVLPHGALDLKNNIPSSDIDLVGPTATLLIKDSLHPALINLLLKALDQVHSDPGIFENKNEFPIDKGYQFPINDDAKAFYKTGSPFWQKHLPFWLASLVGRFIFLVIPLIVLLLPLVKAIPRFYQWRIRTRIFRHYGELNFIDTQIKSEKNREKYPDYMERLDEIEESVRDLKAPVTFSDHIYSLRGHIDFVRKRLVRKMTPK